MEATSTSFGDALRCIRRQVDCKQATLAFEVGCTDAAFSHWESGARLPTPGSLSRLITALVQSGVSTGDLLELRGAWRLEHLRRLKGRTQIAVAKRTSADGAARDERRSATP
jgi:predicted transcriptional regulator